MKSLADAKFFRVFEAIVKRDNPQRDASTWMSAGVAWQHARHAFQAPNYGFAIEVFEGTRSGKNGWTLMVTKEHWWSGKHGDVIRSTNWAKPIKGQRSAVLSWFEEQRRELGSTL